MFSNIDIAKETFDELLEARKVLARSVANIKGRCSEEEYFRYRKGIAEALGILIIELMTPITDQYPSLVPPGEAP